MLKESLLFLYIISNLSLYVIFIAFYISSISFFICVSCRFFILFTFFANIEISISYFAFLFNIHKLTLIFLLNFTNAVTSQNCPVVGSILLLINCLYSVLFHLSPKRRCADPQFFCSEFAVAMIRFQNFFQPFCLWCLIYDHSFLSIFFFDMGI